MTSNLSFLGVQKTGYKKQFVAVFFRFLNIFSFRLIEEIEIMRLKLQWFNAGYKPPRKHEYVVIEGKVNDFVTETGERICGKIFLFAW